MPSFFIISTTLIFRSRVSCWHDTLQAYTALGYFSVAKSSLKLKPDKSKGYNTALRIVNTALFKRAGQASNKSDCKFRKSEERPLLPPFFC